MYILQTAALIYVTGSIITWMLFWVAVAKAPRGLIDHTRESIIVGASLTAAGTWPLHIVDLAKVAIRR
jgi:uncharacterized membrane protein